MRSHNPLDAVFSGRSSVRVLRALYELPVGYAASGREIARRSGLSHPTATAILRSLSDQGLVLATRTPSSDSFELNRDHAFASAIALLLETEQGLDDDLRDFIRSEITRRDVPLQGAFLFGSATEGRASESSDIDLAVLCAPDDQDAVMRTLEDVAETVRLRFGNRLNVVVSTDSGDNLKRGSGAQLWRRILADGRPIIEPSRRRGHA